MTSSAELSSRAAQLASVWCAARVVLSSAVGSGEASSAGGSLASQLDQHGVGALGASLADGERVELQAPKHGILEYDVTLTGLVKNRQIHTLDDAQKTDDPLLSLIELGKKLLVIFARSRLAALALSTRPKGGGGSGQKGS